MKIKFTKLNGMKQVSKRMSVGVWTDGNNKRHKKDNRYLNSSIGDSYDGCNARAGVDEIIVAVAITCGANKCN